MPGFQDDSEKTTRYIAMGLILCVLAIIVGFILDNAWTFHIDHDAIEKGYTQRVHQNAGSTSTTKYWVRSPEPETK